MASIVVVRHGRTEWSQARRHTGRTDVPLDEVGRRQAAALAPDLATRSFAAVFCSPLRRARETAALAGLSVTFYDDDLMEWDYGGYEGLTGEDIAAQRGTPWDLFTDGVVAGSTPGETDDEVGVRCDAVLERCRPFLAAGDDVALVAHAHLLRVLAARWLQQSAAFAAHLELDTAARGRLSDYHGYRTLAAWNIPVPDAPT